ncbi:9483_t:CDS:2, partial [Ambispora leptoticha]
NLKEDESYEFDFPAYKWLIFDNEDFQGRDFQEVIDKYWFEEDCTLSRFLIDHVIMVDINLENPNMDSEGFRKLAPKGLDWETTPTLSNFETIQNQNCHKDDKWYEDLDSNFSWDYIRCRD